MDDLLTKVTALNEEGKYEEAMDELARCGHELDYALALQLARALINFGNQSLRPDEAYAEAQEVLDRFALSGKDDPYWLFYKGYTLLKQGLIQDCVIRLERAQKLVPLSDPALMQRVSAVLAWCREVSRPQTQVLTEEDAGALRAHGLQYFGKERFLCGEGGIELYVHEKSEEHPWQLVVTRGLSAACLPVPQGFDPESNAHLELCLALPEQWDFAAVGRGAWPLRLLIALGLNVLKAQEFMGFGYTADYRGPLSAGTKFCGAMLTALGGYAHEAQSCRISMGSVNFFEVLPLLPLEIAYRQHHSAKDLLDLFRLRRITLSPILEGRPDVCGSLSVKKV